MDKKEKELVRPTVIFKGKDEIDLYVRLKHYCIDHHKTLNSVIIQAIKEFIEKMDKNNSRKES